MMSEKIILVDKNDVQIGTGEKLQVHKDGFLHRAFSVFVFNSKCQLLLQKRHRGKYHSGGLWSNTCCSHPCEGEDTLMAAHRRLKEEMGFDCNLKEIYSFSYKIEFKNGLIENELDHVFVGRFDDQPMANAKEVEDYKWVSKGELLEDIKNNPNIYTYWFKEIAEKIFNYVS